MVEHLPNKFKALGLAPSSGGERQKKEEKGKTKIKKVKSMVYILTNNVQCLF